MRQTTLRRRTSAAKPSGRRAVPHRVASRWTCPLTAICCSRRAYAALPVRAVRPAHAATSAAPRCSTSRSRGSPSGCSSPASRSVVIGVSGGLDSTQALLVCAQAMDRLGLAAQQHPGVHHAGLRHQRAHAGAGPPADAGDRLHGPRARHPPELPADAEATSATRSPTASRSTTSPSRTCRPASAPATCSGWPTSTTGIVVGTGDLSELALGWCTYGVGDHMSHYSVNASVPKTLIQHLIRWVAETQRLATDASDTLLNVLDTEISPELVPGEAGRRRSRPVHRGDRSVRTSCRTSTLYYTLRFGYPPPKVAFLAYCAWHDVERGHLAGHPGGAAPRVRHRRRSSGTWRRSSTASSRLSQFKRSCIPNAPKGRLGRLAVAARRLPRPERRRGDGLGASASADPGRVGAGVPDRVQSSEGSERQERLHPEMSSRVKRACER